MDLDMFGTALCRKTIRGCPSFGDLKMTSALEKDAEFSGWPMRVSVTAGLNRAGFDTSGIRAVEAGGVQTTMRPLGEAKPVTRWFPVDLPLTGQEESSFRHWQS